jgi:hypothetical protein
VWCTVSRNRIIGPTFCDDAIKLERYYHVIYTSSLGIEMRTKLLECYSIQSKCCLGTTARCVRGQNNFEGNLDTKTLRALHYYLWGGRKDAVYKENPQSLPELKEFITNPIRNTLPIELSRVFTIKIRCVDASLFVFCCGFSK